jgi:N-carbamoyl-L-amino-acid hydrolase
VVRLAQVSANEGLASSDAVDLALARRLFGELHAIGFDGTGITRASYGAGENAAHALLARTAEALGLQVHLDWACNLSMTLPGRDRARRVVITGSHLDSVPVGGNYDGAAGVVAGLAVLAAWCRRGYRPACDVTVIAIRAEESVWFPMSYLGSKAAFGLLEFANLAVQRRGDAMTLEACMRAAGGAPEECGRSHSLDPARIDCFVELHIEQGPVLVGGDQPLGIVSGICGSRRYREVRIVGEYAHSGATPRAFRRDAVMAATEFMSALHARWLEIEAAGGEMTLTFGVCYTDPLQADFSTVAGSVALSVDIRARDTGLLDRMDAELHAVRAAVERRLGVSIDPGTATGSQPAAMDPALQEALHQIAATRGVAARTMPSGAGHDAALFADQGVPTAMLFVRNAHGSHNPRESMDEADFAAGAVVLADLLERRSA